MKRVSLDDFVADGGDKEAFARFDKNGDGVLDEDEIRQMTYRPEQAPIAIPVATASSSLPQTEYGTLKKTEDDDDDFDADVSRLTSLGQTDMRAGFITKVYGIVTAQLLVTSLMCYAFMYQHTAHALVLQNAQAVTIASLVFSFGSLIPLMCCYKKVYPTNYILLAVFTTAMACDLGLTCAVYADNGQGFLVLEAAGITGVIFLALTAYTFYSGRDFGFLGMYLFAALVGMLCWGLVAMVFGFDPGMIYSLLGVLVFSGFIVYDTWRLKAKLGPDDYIEGAIELYLDIINLFLFVLDLLGRGSK